MPDVHSMKALNHLQSRLILAMTLLTRVRSDGNWEHSLK